MFIISFNFIKLFDYNMPGMLGCLSAPFSDKTSLLFEKQLQFLSTCLLLLHRSATCKNKFSSYLGWACVGPASILNLRFGFVP
jgi:hypothetical protein